MPDQIYRVYLIAPLEHRRRLLLTTSVQAKAVAVAQGIPSDEEKGSGVSSFQVVDENDVHIIPELASSE